MPTIEPADRIGDEHHPVPDGVILVIAETDEYRDTIDELLMPLKGISKRDWFNDHAYACLPLLIGNQYGFAVRSLYDFEAVWSGGGSVRDVTVTVDHSKRPGKLGHQLISSHFGMGTVTIQNRFHFRTPRGVNLMTINPPNFFIDGVQHMTGVIETDNLRRDFTFNLKLTCPGKTVRVEAGTPIGCVLPIPRYFVDGFGLTPASELFPEPLIELERQLGREFADERRGPDRHKKRTNGHRYFNGEDVRGLAFADHQTKLR